MGAFLHENVALKHVDLNSTPGWGRPVMTPPSTTYIHAHTHTLTGGMQQAIGQSSVVSVAQTQLAGRWWDAYVGTNALLWLWAQGLDSGLRERISQRYAGWSATPGQHSECCVRSLAWFCFDCVCGSARGIALFVCRALKKTNNNQQLILLSSGVVEEKDFFWITFSFFFLIFCNTLFLGL